MLDKCVFWQDFFVFAADLTNKWAFQWVFLNNPEPLIMLLADILEEDIVSVSYLPNQGLAATVNDKQASLDVVCHTSDGRQVT